MINNKTIKAIIPARMTSNRLPGKVLRNLNGKPTLLRMTERVKAAKLLDGIVIATTTNPQDDCIVDFCKNNNLECFRGSENNVLERIIGAAKATNTDIVVEMTSDCPLIFWGHIDYLIDLHMKSYPVYDMTTNIETRSFPRGYDLRIVNIEALERSYKEIDNQPDFEHALTWIYLNPKGKQNYKVQNWEAPPSQHRVDLEFTLDTESDLEFLSWIFSFESQGYNMELNPDQVINLIDTYPHMYQKVSKVQRKDYFEELEQAYAALKVMENRIINGTSDKEPVGIFNAEKNNNKGSEKKNEKVQTSNSRVRKSGNRSKSKTAKRKSN
jgi:spore coat polysaccharide biosynthesis protein SpsF